MANESWMSSNGELLSQQIICGQNFMKRQLDNILTYLRHQITNAMMEGSTRRSNPSKQMLVGLETLAANVSLSCSTVASSTFIPSRHEKVGRALFLLVQLLKINGAYI